MTNVSILGVPFDGKSSFSRGPARAPASIREALWSPAGNDYAESLLKVLDTPWFADAGDVAVAPNVFPLKEIDDAVTSLLNAGTVPIVLGGDHSITFPVLQAIARHSGPVAVLHFDAHNDLYDEFEGDRFSHACPFARILEAGFARSLIQVGIRCMTPHLRQQATRFGVDVIDMSSWAAGIRPLVSAPCYVSIDLDVLDPAFAPGLSHREPGGLTTRELLTAIQSSPVPIVGADIVELNPSRDVDNLTAGTAAKVLKELAARIHGATWS